MIWLIILVCPHTGNDNNYCKNYAYSLYDHFLPPVLFDYVDLNLISGRRGLKLILLVMNICDQGPSHLIGRKAGNPP